jgi:HEAT repeat protein
MVRHEAAEALGAIGGEFAETVLAEYMSDAEQVGAQYM